MTDTHGTTTHATPVQIVNGKEFFADYRGALVPKDVIKPQDLLIDETIGKMFGFAEELSAQLSRFKVHSFADINDLQALLEQQYGARAGGTKGNITLMSLDGLKRVTLQVAEQIQFGPELQVAKSLVDECLRDWSADSNPELRSIVSSAFAVDKEGQIRKAELFRLLRLDIADERWNRAMQALRDSMRPSGSKEYVRFHKRARHGADWEAVSLDIATL